MSDGTLVIKKAGTATLTATSFSGRSDSVTIQFSGDGETTVVEEEKKEETVVEEMKDGVKVLKTILKEDFASSVGSFEGRGAAGVAQTTAGIAADSAKGYMKVTGRTATWNGAVTDVTSLVEPGSTYLVTGWVRYTAGENTETFKITQERTSSEDAKYVPISQDVAVTKGNWTQISGILQVTPSTTQCLVYLETASLIDFYVDNVVIEKIDAAPVEGEKVVLQEIKVGDTVVKRDFEDGLVLEARGNSTRTLTNTIAKNGKASLEVTRSAGWDGAGFTFSSDNKLVKASYFGRTVHVSAYVMYKDGAEEVDFKLNNKMETADNGDNIVSQIPVKKGEWTLIEADCYIAKDATGNFIFIETENDGALTFYIDDFTISVVK
jgi:endo-1,4-beta-xylanase